MSKLMRFQTKRAYYEFEEHDVERFSEYIDFERDGKKGFRLQTGEEFFFDDQGGWEDEKGCYYDENGEPSGWFVKCEDEKEHFFDIDGNYVPTDDEDDYELNSWEATQQKPAQNIQRPVKQDSTPSVQVQQKNTGVADLTPHIYKFQLIDSQDVGKDLDLLTACIIGKVGYESIYEFLQHNSKKVLSVKTKGKISVLELGSNDKIQYNPGKFAQKYDDKRK